MSGQHFNSVVIGNLLNGDFGITLKGSEQEVGVRGEASTITKKMTTATLPIRSSIVTSQTSGDVGGTSTRTTLTASRHGWWVGRVRRSPQSDFRPAA